jgi:hypothetical protein
MKILTTLFLIAVSLSGCTPTELYGPIRVVVYDDCEYISAHNSLAHKGNCKFCERRRLSQDSVATMTYAEIIKMYKEEAK